MWGGLGSQEPAYPPTASPTHLNKPLQGLLWASATAPRLVPGGRSHPACRLGVLLAGRKQCVWFCVLWFPRAGLSGPAPRGVCHPQGRGGGGCLTCRTQSEVCTLRTPMGTDTPALSPLESSSAGWAPRPQSTPSLSSGPTPGPAPPPSKDAGSYM